MSQKYKRNEKVVSSAEATGYWALDLAPGVQVLGNQR